MLQQLLDVNKAKSDIKKVDGTNYGCPYTGYYDQPFTLLQKLLVSYLVGKGFRSSTRATREAALRRTRRLATS